MSERKHEVRCMKGKIKGRVGDLQTKQMVFQEVRKEMMGDSFRAFIMC